MNLRSTSITGRAGSTLWVCALAAWVLCATTARAAANCSSLRAAESIVVPNGFYEVEGNSSLQYPFGTPSILTVRYQQVFDASQFSLATNGGWIYKLYFRANGFSEGFSGVISNIEIHLSTTPKSPDGLSTVFRENVGPDEVLVFSNSLRVANPTTSAPEPFDLNMISLSTNFWYHPGAGNLLLDVKVHKGVESATPLLSDAVNTPGDSVSRVYAIPVDATSGTTDTRGLVMLIEMAAMPSLCAYISSFGTATNFIAIRWPTQPNMFVLEESKSLGPDAVWRRVPAADVEDLSVFREYKVPMSLAGPAAFYRLIWPAGP